MSSFGTDIKSIHAVKNTSDYTRRILSRDELKDITVFQPLLSWWKEKHVVKQQLPSRKDFNPAAFQSILPNISIFDLVFKDEELVDLLPTLIGTNLTKVYGEETGKLISEMNNEYLIQGALNASRECIRRREPLGIVSEITIDSENMPFERSFSLYCPLATDNINIDKLIVPVFFK